MTIFPHVGNMHFEFHTVARANIGAGALSSDIITLNKGGRLLAVVGVVDCDLTAVQAADIGYYVNNSVGNVQLNFGDALTTIQVRRWNNSAGGLTFGVHIIVAIQD